MFWQRFRHELKVSGQHLILFYLTVPIAFMRWVAPPASISDKFPVQRINLWEAWNLSWKYTSQILLVFTILCAVRLVLVLAWARWRGEI